MGFVAGTRCKIFEPFCSQYGGRPSEGLVDITTLKNPTQLSKRSLNKKGSVYEELPVMLRVPPFKPKFCSSLIYSSAICTSDTVEK